MSEHILYSYFGVWVISLRILFSIFIHSHAKFKMSIDQLFSSCFKGKTETFSNGPLTNPARAKYFSKPTGIFKSISL